MDGNTTRNFAQRLMQEVWEVFAPEAVPQFYHRNVVGHHRRADGSWQALGYEDVVNRLTWDKATNAHPVFEYRELIVEENRFFLRFLYTADFIPTGAKLDVEVMYYYHVRDEKVAEFGLLSNVDFDYTVQGTLGTQAR